MEVRVCGVSMCYPFSSASKSCTSLYRGEQEGRGKEGRRKVNSNRYIYIKSLGQASPVSLTLLASCIHPSSRQAREPRKSRGTRGTTSTLDLKHRRHSTHGPPFLPVWAYFTLSIPSPTFLTCSDTSTMAVTDNLPPTNEGYGTREYW